MEAGILSRKYIVAPFTTLDARSGVWAERKRAWLSLGIRGEVGRDASLYSNKWAASKGLTGLCTSGNTALEYTSIFDPVLTELLIEWHCPRQGHVLDPFAGGPVRGVVASRLGRSYTGIELRAEQVAANEVQRNLLGDGVVSWIVGDSAVVLRDTPPVLADMILTCPPYGDLEVYSDDPADVSNIARQDYARFLATYREILAAAVACLKPDRFVAIVVGDYRNKAGWYRNFVGDTVEAARAAGLSYYNELVLLTSLGNAAMRAEKQFNTSRKNVKVHQNVLIFVKGDPKAATQACLKDAPESLGYAGLPTVSKPKRGNARRDVSVGVAPKLQGKASVGDSGVGVENGSTVLTETRELGGEGDGGVPVTSGHEVLELG